MKKIYQQPQTLTATMQTGMPLQTSGLPSSIQDPSISGGSGSRELRDFEETSQSSSVWDEGEDY
jgi:hypothetical protein